MDMLDSSGNSVYLHTDYDRYPKPVSFQLKPGLNQKFPENSFTLNTDIIDKNVLFHTDDVETYPIVIELRKKENSYSKVFQQTTFIYLKEADTGLMKPKVDLQKVKIGTASYE
jgi:hypothetical protein